MRMPVAAGFYPFSKTKLIETIEELSDKKTKKRSALGAISPHAGYEYCGEVMGKVYSSIDIGKKETFAIFCPNHTGYGSPVALSDEDWKTPLGIIKVDGRFASKLPVSSDAHLYEHSLEVQLPFIQYNFKDSRIIPICLSHLQFEELKKLSEIIAADDIFYVASSDFTHFGPNYSYMPVDKDDKGNLEYVRKLDEKAIEIICRLDARRFYDFVMKNEMTICGAIPITLLLLVCKKLGAKKGELLQYTTSYEKNPDRSFVSYAGILIF